MSAPDREIKAYDFRRPDRFSREQLRALSRVSESFARAATTRLSSALRMPCDLSLDQVDQMTFGEYLEPLGSREFIGVASMEPLGDGAVIRLDPDARDLIAERLFGSAKPRLGAGTAKLGVAEAAVMERVASSLLDELGPAWATVEPVTPRLRAAETDPRFCQVVPPLEMIVLCRFSLEAAGERGVVDLVYPFLLLEPVVKKLSSLGSGAVNRGAAIGAEARRLPLRADIAVEAGSLSVEALRALRRGSIVALPSLDSGVAVLRLGGATVAGLSGLRREAGRVVASFARPVEGSGSADPSEALNTTLRIGLESMRRSMDGVLGSLTRRVDELEGGQETLSDRVSFGEADSARIAARPLSALEAAQPSAVAALLSAERPQLRAMVLANIDDAPAAAILAALPDEAQAEAARRVATMDRVAPETLALAGRALGATLSAEASDAPAGGGIKKVVGMLNLAPRETERRVIGALDALEPELSESIKRSMFVFEDIIILDDESIAAVLESVDERDVVIAMKPMAERERERLFSRLPDDRRDRIKAAFEELGRVRLSECDAAGHRVVEAIRELEKAGLIGIMRNPA